MSLARVSELLTTFQELFFQNQIDRFQNFEVGFARIQEGLKPLVESAKEKEAFTAHRFNIFSLLNMENDEVKTHSRLLKELLSPESTHAQGALFLENFLLLLYEIEKELQPPSMPLIPDHWLVKQELNTDYGRIDLVISNRYTGYLVVIENKIYSDERDSQLERYAHWMKTMKTVYANQILVFLTPNGSKAKTANLNNYLKLSYHRDIVNWLENCLPQIKASRVNEVLQQYLDIIKKL